MTPNPRGQQVGLLPVGWTAAARDDRLFAGLATPRRGVQWNYDLVVEPPPGTVVLAETAAGEMQVARYGPAAWGVQLHPRSTRRSWPPGSPTPSAPSWPTEGSTRTRWSTRSAPHAPSSTTRGRRWRRGSLTSRLATGVTHPTSDKGRLSRLGFADAESAETGLWALGKDAAEPLVALIARTADPDLALASLIRLVEAAGPESADRLLRALVDDEAPTEIFSALAMKTATDNTGCCSPASYRLICRLSTPAAAARSACDIPSSLRR